MDTNTSQAKPRKARTVAPEEPWSENDPVWKPKDTARYFRLSMGHFWRLVHDGTIPAIALSERVYRFDRDVMLELRKTIFKPKGEVTS